MILELTEKETEYLGSLLQEELRFFEDYEIADTKDGRFVGGLAHKLSRLRGRVD